MQIRFYILEGKNLGGLSSEDLRHVRRDFQMVFQDPYASLNPRMSVYDTLAEAILAHKKISRSELPTRVAELMKKVGYQSVDFKVWTFGTVALHTGRR